MAHEHHHHHGESLRDYFTEQLLTIFVVGLFGFVAIRMYQNGMLGYILAPQFHLPVLIGGIVVLVLVAVRAVSVWREAGATQAHTHDHGHEHHHEHGADCGHDHGADCGHDHHHGHTHDHGHDHGHDHHHDHAAEDHGHSHDLAWVFARMLVLFFPVALFFIGVPNAGFSQDRINKLLGSDAEIAADLGTVNSGYGTAMTFADLNDAAYDEGKRKAFQGQVGILEGQFRRLGDKQFTLYRLKMTCCATDMVPLKVQIITPTALSGFTDGQWVQVKGEVRFVQRPNSTQFIPVVAVAEMKDITPIKPLE